MRYKTLDKAQNAISGASLLFTLVAAMLLMASCTPKQNDLPIFGEREVNGSDTIYHKIAPFKFVDQDSATITNEVFKDKIYVADFFFTSCRTICPIMKTQMVRVYEATKDMPDVLLLSHSIDPEYDTVALLHDFAERLGVESKRWHFVTGVKDSIYKIAQTSYFATAMEDKAEPDGFIHSGAFLLIDKQGRIRGKYDGTKEEDVNRLIGDIKDYVLSMEYNLVGSKQCSVGSRLLINCLLLSAYCLLLSSCSTKDPKFQQYYVQGEQLYIKNCSNCHQKDGKGLGLLYPPLHQSDYVDKNFNEVLCLMRQGKEGELIVNGKTFNKPMPGIPSLTDLEIAEIATYIYNTWDRQHGLIEVKEATAILNNCK